MNAQQITQETIQRSMQAAREALADPKLTRAISVGTGLVGYNLQAPAKQLVPLLSPFYNSIPRKTKPGANSDNWKAITAISSPRLFTGERKAGAKIAHTVADKSAGFKVQALLGDVSLEAVQASEGFDPALQKETANILLKGLQLSSQAYMFGVLTDLGVPAAPTVTEIESLVGATIGAASYFVRIVGMSGMAANRVTLDVPQDYDGTHARINGRAVAVVNPLRDDAGAAITAASGLTSISAEGTVTTTGTLNSLKITWTPVAGMIAYAVFIGTTTGAANLKCEAIVTQASVTFLTLAGTGLAGNAAEIPGADETGDSEAFDGIVSQLVAAGSGAYLKNVLGKLTGSNSEITEIQDAFATIYQTGKIGKFRVVISGVDERTLTRLGVSSQSMQIFAAPGIDGRVAMAVGAHVTDIINATTGDRCPVEVDPWLPAGTIIILPTEVPYANSNVSSPFEWVGSYDWMRWDYGSTPASGPVYLFETRCNGVLEALFTGGCGLLYNIFKG